MLHGLLETVVTLQYVPSPVAGPDSADATCSQRPGEDFTAGLLPLEQLGSAPLAGRRLAVIQETSGEGVDAGVAEAAGVLMRGAGAASREQRRRAVNAEGACLISPDTFRATMGAATDARQAG